MIKAFILISIFLASVNCYTEPHEFFVDQKICTLNSTKTYENFFKIIKLNCDWTRFFDLEHRAPALEPTKSRTEVIYEFKFESKPSSGSSDNKYLHVKKDFLKNFKVRSLTLRSLNLISIDEHAFGKENFGIYLETLDLSRNSLSRLDSHILANLIQLQSLLLADNSLKFSENNFANNIYLRKIDLSFNRIQFLTPNLFHGLNQLESIDLRGNNIREIKACIFNDVQTNELSRKYSPVVINLDNNPINCDCDVFYLERHLNYKVEVTCDKPSYYKSKTLKQLAKEDPEYRCDYSAMQKSCSVKSSLDTIELTVIIVLASLVVLFLLITCCCYCKNSSQSSKIENLKADLKNRVENSKPKKIYANINLLESKQKSSDAQALISH